MGATATRGVVEAASYATDDELKEAVDGLSLESKAKIKAAMKARQMAEVQLLPEDIDTVRAQLAEDFGTSADDDADANPKLDEFTEGLDGLNWYDYIALMMADPNQDVSRTRSYLKTLFLPCIQVGTPFLLIYHQLGDYDFSENGICPDSDEIYFRVLGFMMMIYSIWQISDAVESGPTTELCRMSARHYSVTALKSHLFKFSCGFWLQSICAFSLQICLYILLSASDDPMDLVLNCVALNFPLGIDDEWMDDTSRRKATKAAQWLFKDWRDSADNKTELITKRLKTESKFTRRVAEQWVINYTNIVTSVISLTGYVVSFFFLGCRPEW
jgi:hypothetical protein